jgi:hypothetical protein
MRRLTGTALAAAALAVVPAAVASGPNVPGLQGGGGIASARDGVRYVALPSTLSTVVTVARTSDGTVLRYASVPGSWAIPVVSTRGQTGGLSHDGRTLVLADAGPQTTPLRTQTRFTVVDTKTLATVDVVTLRGDFSYDALSPDARTLYLVEHVSSQDLTRYQVRAYDLPLGRLLPQAIADKRQAGWVMAGYPAGRVAGADGRWVYTLYRRSGGYPFVHALDSVGRVAVCIGLPWPLTQSQDALASGTMTLSDGGRRLVVRARTGRQFVVDTTTLRLVHAAPHRSSAALFGGIGGAIAIVAAIAFALGRRVAARRST